VGRQAGSKQMDHMLKTTVDKGSNGTKTEPMGTRTKASKELRENVPPKQIQPPSFSKKERKIISVAKRQWYYNKDTTANKMLCVKHYRFRLHHLVYSCFCWSQHIDGFVVILLQAQLTTGGIY
jgi:hypothetical protein